MRTHGTTCMIVVLLSMLAVGLTAAPPAGAASAYPEPDKVIEFLHHSSPGGAAGLFVLTSGDILNKAGIVKAKIQTQTRQGGSSAVALNYLKSKKGDPYVVMHWTTAQLMAMLRGTTEMKLEECVWLSTLIEDGNVLMVPYDSPYKTVKDLIDDAKANPNKVNVGINSIGGSEHVMASRIERATGVKFTITSFDFSPTQLIGGHIALAFGSVAETSGHVKAKRARVLANMGTTRVPYYKDIPTMMEQGIPVSFTQYRGFFGGPNFPADAVKFWDDAFAKLMKTKQYEEFMKKFDVVPSYRTAAETKALVAEYVKGLQEDLKHMDLK
jgi:putative tricarboxylic transport membrane protein